MSGLEERITELSEELDENATLSQPHKSNALSNKLTTVLSTSFADTEIREALRTLDERKIQNNPETRRRLRLDAQKEVIDCNSAIIQDFGQVAEQLKRIGSTIASLNRCCADIRRHVANAHRETGPMVEETTTLFLKKEEIDTKKQILDAFNSHFIISEEDLLILTAMTVPVNDEFFLLLARLKRIHAECQVLLGSESQQLGLELMDMSSRHLNSAFQKLHRSIQNEFKTLNLENPQMSASIRRSLRLLAERPALFQNCLDFFAEAREHNLSDAFYAAITGTNSSTEDRATKPMDYYAHDPLRFVGDMLAWTHSATVSEREALEVLFISEGDEMAKGIQAGIESEPWEQEGTEAFNGRKYLEQLVNRDLAGVSRALRQRVEQVIRSDEDPVLAYKIANLIDFYRITFERLLGADSAVLAMLAELQQSALHQYRTTMQEQVNLVRKDVPQPPADLDILDFLTEALSQLRELMKSYDSSLAPAESRESGFVAIMGESLDPFLETCDHAARKLDDPANSIFSINCIIATKNTLTFEFAADRVSELDDTLEEYSAKLIDYQHAYFLHTSGLHPLLVALAPLTDSEDDLKSIAKLDPFQTQALTDTSQVLDDFLPSAVMDAMENLKRLKNSKMAEDITGEAANRFCEDFEYVEGRLTAADELLERGDGGMDEQASKDGSDAPIPLRELFPRTSGEIRVLLS